MTFSDLISQNIITVIAIPLIAALIGWITNYIAVKMIFRPKDPINFLGIKIQGLVPKRQKDLAHSMGETVQRDLISHEDVTKILESDDVKNEVFGFIDIQIDKMISDFIAKNPMLGMFLNDEILGTIKQSLNQNMRTAVPEILGSLVTKVEDNLDFKKIVEDKINSFDLTKLEDIVFRIASRELKTIEYLGGILGFVVGLAQVAIMLYTQKL